MSIKIVIPSTTSGGTAVVDIRDGTRVKVGVGTLEAEKDVLVREFDGTVYAQAVKDASNVVLNSTQTSGFLEGPGKYEIVLPSTSTAASVCVTYENKAAVYFS